MKSGFNNALCWLVIYTLSFMCYQTSCLAEDQATDPPSSASQSQQLDGDQNKDKSPQKNTQDTLGVVDRWSAENAVTQPQRELITLQGDLKLISTDLQSQPEANAPFLRYLTLANLYNIRGIDGNSMESDTNMEVYRTALSDLMKCISKTANANIVTAIDSAKTLFRFDLRECGLTRQGWESIIDRYPYGVIDPSADAGNRIEAVTGSRQAWLRVDWFAFAASQPPMSNGVFHVQPIVRPGSPIESLCSAYTRDIFQEQACAEFWTDQHTLLDILDRSRDPALSFLGSKIQNGLPCSRDSFIQPFRSGIREIGLKLLENSAQNAAGSDDSGTGAPSDNRPDKVQIPIPGGGTLTLAMSQLFYRIGDSLQFTVSADTDCYIKIVQLGSDRSETQLVPNAFNTTNRIHSGESRVFPGKSADGKKFLKFTTTPPPGPEILLALVSRSQFRDDSKLPEEGTPFRQYKQNTLIGTRGVILVQAGSDQSPSLETAITKGEVGYLLEPDSQVEIKAN